MGAIAIVVEVVEFTDVRKAALQHLGIHERGNSLQPLRLETLDETVHELAPGPEAVARGASALRKAR